MTAQSITDKNGIQVNPPSSVTDDNASTTGQLISGPSLNQPTDTPPTLPSKQTEPQEMQEEESPLQALAKKLAQLKDELVEEEPKQEEVEEKALEFPQIPSDQPPQVQNEPLTNDIPIVQEPKQEVPAEEITPLDIPSVTQEEIASDEVPQEPLLVDQPPLEQELEQQEEPKIEEIPAPPLEEQTVLPKEIPIVDAPAVDVQSQSTLDQLYPEINAQAPSSPSQPPATPVIEEVVPSAPITSSSEEIDENDNTQVASDVVESIPASGKYPMNINQIMEVAIERNASDIQISVGYPVMIRIDGTLVAVNEQKVSKDNSEELIMPVLSEQKKELLEVNREIDLAYSPGQEAKARFRINAYYSTGGLTAAFRLIPSKVSTIEELLLPPMYNQLALLKQGLVLVTGPTGHGKSTTLAAMIQAVNMNRAVHILTIEDPIEYIFKPAKAVIDQREMYDDTHSWTVALKSALRQDPDVILVGEMRDYETIAATITLAETGHLVFATLHTNSASQAVDRIIDVFPENQQAQVRTQLANIIEAVVSQRLIPIDGGGRRAVSEIMLGIPAVRNLIREGKTYQIDNVIRTSADVGMISLEQSLVKLVREGIITMDKAQEYAVHPEEVVRLLKS